MPAEDGGGLEERQPLSRAELRRERRRLPHVAARLEQIVKALAEHAVLGLKQLDRAQQQLLVHHGAVGEGRDGAQHANRHLVLQLRLLHQRAQALIRADRRVRRRTHAGPQQLKHYPPRARADRCECGDIGGDGHPQSACRVIH
eukprot:scaffold2373_cov239-Pinguiococcus_pyrenoidosus.AAC.6